MRQLNSALHACVLVLLLLVAVLPLAAHAQTAPDLVVTLRDGAGVGIVGAIITVRDRDGEGVLAQSQTDTSGTATIPNVLMSDVRIVVTGKASNGVTLQQLASDAGGIALFLDGAQTTQLDLRVEDDGTVIPDPREMIVPEVVPPTAAPTVLTVIAPTSGGAVATVLPTASLLMMASPVSGSTLAPTVSPAASSPTRLVGFVLGGLVLAAVVGQLSLRAWQQRRSR